MSMLFRRNTKPTRTSQITSLQDEMNRMFDNFFRGWNEAPELKLPTNKGTITWSPTVDIKETQNEFKVKAELPGLEEKDIEITFHDNTLFLKGEKKFESEEKEDDYQYMESSYGYFQRAIPFATTIDEEKISASFKNGILTVELGKERDVVEKTRKINIK